MTNAFDYKNWVCPVNGKTNWKLQNANKVMAHKVSEKLESARLEDKGYGTIVGLSNKEPLSLLPRNFHVYSKAGTK